VGVGGRKEAPGALAPILSPLHFPTGTGPYKEGPEPGMGYTKHSSPSGHICYQLRAASKLHRSASVAQGVNHEEEGREKPNGENPTLLLGQVFLTHRARKLHPSPLGKADVWWHQGRVDKR